MRVRACGPWRMPSRGLGGRPRTRWPSSWRSSMRSPGAGRGRAAVVPPVTELPAWGEPFAAGHRDALERSGPWGRVDRAWAFGDGSGRGLRVAIVDSGVEGSHPAVGGRLVEAVAVERRGEDWAVVPSEPNDVVGHGTACAGIIHDLAPEAELVSVRVLGPDNRGNGGAFATGLLWAIESSGASVVNLSLSSRSDALFGALHELADEAYFRNVLLVSAANNVSVASYPSLYAAVVSVAAHDVPDPAAWFYNPAPPVEFGALRAQRGRRVARRDPDVRDREQLRGAPHRGLRDPDPRRAPRDHPVRGEGGPRSHRRQRAIAALRRPRIRKGRPPRTGPLNDECPGSAIAVRVVPGAALDHLALRGGAAAVETLGAGLVVDRLGGLRPVALDVLVVRVLRRRFRWPSGPASSSTAFGGLRPVALDVARRPSTCMALRWPSGPASSSIAFCGLRPVALDVALVVRRTWLALAAGPRGRPRPRPPSGPSPGGPRRRSSSEYLASFRWPSGPASSSTAFWAFARWPSTSSVSM